MGTDQEILKKFEILDSSNTPSYTTLCLTDELDWSLNLNEFELSLIRDILSNGGTPDDQTLAVFSDIYTILPQHESKSPEMSTISPDMDGTLPAVRDAIDVTLSMDSTAGNCDEVVSGGKEQQPPPLVEEAFHPSLPGRRYRGVRQSGGKFTAKIKIKNPDKSCMDLWLGTYNTAEEAALAFDRAAFKHRGSCAVLNFPHLFGVYDESPETTPPRSSSAPSPESKSITSFMG